MVYVQSRPSSAVVKGNAFLHNQDFGWVKAKEDDDGRNQGSHKDALFKHSIPQGIMIINIIS